MLRGQRNYWIFEPELMVTWFRWFFTDRLTSTLREASLKIVNRRDETDPCCEAGGPAFGFLERRIAHKSYHSRYSTLSYDAGLLIL